MQTRNAALHEPKASKATVADGLDGFQCTRARLIRMGTLWVDMGETAKRWDCGEVGGSIFSVHWHVGTGVSEFVDYDIDGTGIGFDGIDGLVDEQGQSGWLISNPKRGVIRAGSEQGDGDRWIIEWRMVKG